MENIEFKVGDYIMIENKCKAGDYVPYKIQDIKYGSLFLSKLYCDEYVSDKLPGQSVVDVVTMFDALEDVAHLSASEYTELAVVADDTDNGNGRYELLIITQDVAAADIEYLECLIGCYEEFQWLLK